VPLRAAETGPGTIVSAPFVIRFESVNSIAPEAAAPLGSVSL